jgi:hypothetical protein
MRIPTHLFRETVTPLHNLYKPLEARTLFRDWDRYKNRYKSVTENR